MRPGLPSGKPEIHIPVDFTFLCAKSPVSLPYFPLFLLFVTFLYDVDTDYFLPFGRKEEHSYPASEHRKFFIPVISIYYTSYASSGTVLAFLPA